MAAPRKQILLIAAVLVAAYLARGHRAETPAPAVEQQQQATTAAPPRAIGAASNPLAPGRVQGVGTVTRILPDDNDGARHQRFVLQVGAGRTLLVAHNIDVAPRVSPLRVGDTVEYSGEFVTNDRGGVVHWTHHDPSGRHPAGWLRHDGAVFQ